MTLALVLVAALGTGNGGPVPPASAPAPAPVEARGVRVTTPADFAALYNRTRVPSFARQLRLSCGVCHVGFPELTWFGRMFKLNGYTLSGLERIVDQLDSTSRRTLALTPIPAMSVSALVSSTSVNKALPGTSATRSEYPQQLSVFWGGQVSTDIGALLQLTYSDVAGRIGMDISDIRYARHSTLGSRDLLLGVTLHNTPTAQDPWNTLPAWSFPFASAALAPHPAAAPMLDGSLATQVLGLGAYVLFNQHLYAEVTGYTSAPQGPRAVVDSSVSNVLGRVAPYWRVALQQTLAGTYLMLGTFGLSADVYPEGIRGQPNHFNDYGMDAQVERRVGDFQLIGRGSWTREDQSMVNGYAALPRAVEHVANSLSSMRANATMALPWMALTLGAFSTLGTSDRVEWAGTPVTGSAAGRPDTKGQIAELVLNPWLNSRVGLQYVRYDTFNGRASSYDLPSGGRNASDNNSVYLYLWFAF